jgi:hypothetical protein
MPRFTVKLWACLVAFACVAGALASSASATVSTFVWNGQSTSDGNWSTGGNWGDGSAPTTNASVTTFDFPALTGCSPPKACFTSTNDVSGLSANTLRVDLTGGYTIGGAQALSLTGGLTTVGSGGSANLTLPLEASGPNLWSITGDLTVGGTISSSDLTKAFSIDMADSAAALRLSADDEVGDVTAAPPTLPNPNSGVDAPANGTITLFGAGQLNGSDNQSVTLDQVALAGAGTVGALISHGGELQVGNPGNGTPGKLIDSGVGLDLDPHSAAVFTLKNGTANPAPGTDFGQLNIAGDVTLEGGTLEVFLNHFSCPTLQIGAVYTLMQAGGVIGGFFTNAPDGTVITTPNPTGCGAGASFRINYTTHTVTATVVSNGPPTGPGGSTGTPLVIPATASVVSSSSESNNKFRVARNFRAVTVSRRRPPVGTTFRYTLDKAAAVRFDFTQRAPGRKVHGRCVAPNRHNKHKRKCTRTVTRGSLSFAGHAGQNTVTFYGWLRKHKKLKPGKYTLVITATTPGVGSTSQRLKFTIVR